MCARNLALEEGGGSSTCSPVGGQHGELEVWTEKGDCQEVALQRVLYKKQPEDVSTLLQINPKETGGRRSGRVYDRRFACLPSYPLK